MVVVVRHKQKYVHKVLVNPLFKLAQEKSVDGWTDNPDMTIAVYWGVKQQNKLMLAQLCCGYLLEAAHREASNKYLQHSFIEKLEKYWKKLLGF